LPTDGLILYASVPVALRARADTAAVGNQVGLMIVPLPVGEPDPVQQLRHITRATTRRKRRPERLASLRPVGSLTILRALNRYSRHQRIVDVFVTNVPGPQRPLYLLGARLLEEFPVKLLSGRTSSRSSRKHVRTGGHTIRAGTSGSSPKSTRPTVSRVRGWTPICWVIACTSRNARSSGHVV